VKCWVYRGDRLGHGEAPAATPMPQEDDRRPRRGPPRGPGGAPGGRDGRGRGPGTDRAPRATGAPADGSDKPAAAGVSADAPKTPAVKRVRKAPTPGAAPGSEGKGE
jgi:small subunit ribosomal protein S3